MIDKLFPKIKKSEGRVCNKKYFHFKYQPVIYAGLLLKTFAPKEIPTITSGNQASHQSNAA
jgi:hypothetical protein